MYFSGRRKLSPRTFFSRKKNENRVNSSNDKIIFQLAPSNNTDDLSTYVKMDIRMDKNKFMNYHFIDKSEDSKKKLTHILQNSEEYEISFRITRKRKRKQCDSDFNEGEPSKKKTKLENKPNYQKLEYYKKKLTPNEIQFFDYCKNIIDEALKKKNESFFIAVNNNTFPGSISATNDMNFYYYLVCVQPNDSEKPTRVYNSLEAFYFNNHNLGLFFGGCNGGTDCSLYYLDDKRQDQLNSKLINKSYQNCIEAHKNKKLMYPIYPIYDPSPVDHIIDIYPIYDPSPVDHMAGYLLPYFSKCIIKKLKSNLNIDIVMSRENNFILK